MFQGRFTPDLLPDGNRLSFPMYWFCGFRNPLVFSPYMKSEIISKIAFSMTLPIPTLLDSLCKQHKNDRYFPY